MEIVKNYDLKSLNTFGVNASAKFFTVVEKEPDISELFASDEFNNNEKLFLGGGSNILFTKDFNGIVILNKLKGIEILEENFESVIVKSMGGEIWHDLVSFAVARGYWGIENLSLIPGTVGAAPMQNIGAYGVELKDTLESVEAYEIETGEKKIFNKIECEFGYRDSIFKNKLKEKYFISAITLRLNKIPSPNISYKVLKEYLKENNIGPESIQAISNAVMVIRRSKLPDPKEIGNAGSFFKNVYISEEKLKELVGQYPEMPYFREENKTSPLTPLLKEERGKINMIKIPAGWLIEKMGWKGHRVGNVGVHEKQALVLVNYGGASGEEIKNLAEVIIASVYSEFGLTLVPEVNLI